MGLGADRGVADPLAVIFGLLEPGSWQQEMGNGIHQDIVQHVSSVLLDHLAKALEHHQHPHTAMSSSTDIVGEVRYVSKLREFIQVTHDAARQSPIGFFFRTFLPGRKCLHYKAGQQWLIPLMIPARNGKVESDGPLGHGAKIDVIVCRHRANLVAYQQLEAGAGICHQASDQFRVFVEVVEQGGHLLPGLG